MSTLFDNLVSGGGSTYFDDLNSAPTTGTEPSISAVTTCRFGGSATITGVRFGSSQGAGFVTIGGISQAVTAWSDTSITIGPIARGTLKYGTQPVAVTSNSAGSSAPWLQSLLPQTGWSYVDLVNPLASSGNRITATPDLAGGDQLAWGDITPSGTVTVVSDATFTASNTVSSFSVEINDGTGWGSFGTQTLASVAAFSGQVFAAPARTAGSFNIVTVNEWTFSGSIHAPSATSAGSFLAFTSKHFDGTIVSGSATMQGAFTVTGAVVTPPPPPTTPPGTGTPAAKVDIVNIGLVCLGVPTILSFNDNSKAARLASQMYDRIRDAELARYIWKFAIARRNMPEYVSDEPRGSYKYAYAKPVDWLRTVWIGTETLGTPGAVFDPENADWSHEGPYILTNVAPPLPLQYLRRLTDPTKYDVLFSEALGKRFAMEWSDALTDSERKWEKARTEYAEVIAQARRSNSILDPPRGQPADSWLESRN